jgi:hypothetical protein
MTRTGFKTGLFSATVGAFIIEFYKKLSSDPGDETVALLRQISQQLQNSPNSSLSNTANQSSPSAPMVWANAMWLISLVLSLTSALIATLLQQWARRYVETPKVLSEPNDRARVRSFLSLGNELYKMRFLVGLAPTLLHFSVYLFFGGLVIAFHTIHKKVAIAVDVAVGLFALAYTVLTILPFLDIRCPYRTPMTDILWYSWHTFLSSVARIFYWFLEWLPRRLVSPGLDGSTMSSGQRMVVDWLTSCENTAKKHWRYVMDGFGKSIIDSAKSLEDEDRNIITWLFSQLALYDKSKLRKFAACIPRNRVLNLIPLIESGKFVLREPLLTLLRSCARNTRAASPDHDVLIRSLLVCLDVIHHIAKAPSIPDLNFMRAYFANISLMRELWNDNDDSIRITSRSICALVARQVVRKIRIEDADLGWLQEVTGEPSNAILEADAAVRDQMNFKSFVYGVLPNHATHLSTEDATSFKETLAILMNVRTDNRTNLQIRLSEEMRWIQQYDPEGSREIFDRLHSMLPSIYPSVSRLHGAARSSQVTRAL